MLHKAENHFATSFDDISHTESTFQHSMLSENPPRMFIRPILRLQTAMTFFFVGGAYLVAEN